MDGFKDLQIKNFRGIDSLTFEEFARVNVFLGKNNSGKSSVLEALLLLMGMSNPDMPQTLNNIRNRNIFSGIGDIRYLFHNMDFNGVPEIRANQTDFIKRHLALQMTYTFDKNDEQVSSNGQIPTSETKVFLNTLVINYDVTNDNQKKSFTNSLRFNNAGVLINKEIEDGYLEKNSCAFISSDLSGVNLSGELTNLFKRKQKDLVLELLKKFDSSISSIEILQDNVYIGFDNLNEMMSINMVGDGLRRYLHIVACAANPMNNVILIDEIDNGLHHSAYFHLWSTLFILAKETNKQLFITTHSKEVLSKLYEMLDTTSDFQQDLRFYLIDRTKLKGHRSYKYTFEGLKEAYENDIELRGIAL